MNQLFQDMMTNCLNSIEYQQREIKRLLAAQQHLETIDLSDVQYLSTSQYHDDVLEINLTLKESDKGSRLPHRLAQHFGCKFTKKQSYDKSSLVYTGEPNDKLRIEVHGAVPQTCSVEYVEEPIPESQIVRTRKRAIINCVQKELEAVDA